MHSYAQQSDFPCPHCGRSFRAEIWLIVDAGERHHFSTKHLAYATYTLTFIGWY